MNINQADIAHWIVGILARDRLIVGPLGIVTAFIELEQESQWQERNAKWLLRELAKRRKGKA